MLNVIDISNHQKGLLLHTLSADTFIIKLTEGNYFEDKEAKGFITQAKSLNKAYGLYHFLDGSPIKEQVLFFLKHANPYIGEALLVLDYEDYGKQGVLAAKEFLDLVFNETGVRPLIYMNESDANAEDWSPVIKSNYGLWVAKYSSNVPKLTQWPSYAMWQYTSTPYDTSYFYGDLLAWKKYATPIKDGDKEYHTKGKRFRALKDLVIKADDTFKKDTGMVFSKSTVFDITAIHHTKTTTHALIHYNCSEVFVTLRKDYVDQID